MNLITTKFIAPRLPSTLVERPHLLGHLTLSSHTKLVLVSAPAGAGKSTLLSCWLHDAKRSTVWLSLEPSDNDLRQFLLYLIMAVQQVQSQLGNDLLKQLQLQEKIESETFMIQFINQLSHLAAPTVLVLDDYHIINNTSVHAATEFLLEHLPPQLCLAIGSRSDPPFALGRLRARGQLIEARSETLRFGAQEAEVFLNEKFGLGLSQVSVTSLEDRTEGWVAGLQLAALSLAGRPDKEAFVAAFAGSHRYVADYLIDEVLDRQSAQMRRFLQCTSLLDRFTVTLCEAVVAQPVNADLLQRLETANLFLIPLDDERRWYRYHHLFAEFLRHRLRENEPEVIPELHRRASVWLERHGLSDEAIHHALLAGDFEQAGRLVEQITFNLGVYWDSALAKKLMVRLPLELIATFPRLSLYYVWPLLNTGQITALSVFLPVLRQSIPSSQQPRVMMALELALAGYQRMWLMDFAGALELGHQALTVLEDAGPEPTSDEERFLRTGATNLVAYCYLHNDVTEADRFYPIALERSRQLGNLGSMSFTLARHGRVKHRLGELRSAWKLFQTGSGIERIQRREEGQREVNIAELCVSTARLLYEWNRLDEAQSYLEQAKPYSERSQYTPVLALGYQTAFEISLARSETNTAQAQLSKLDRLAHEVDPGNVFFRERFGAPAMHLRLRLAEAAPRLVHLRDEVAAWVEANDLKPDDILSYSYEGSYGVLARLFVAHGNAEGALALLERLAQGAQASERRDDLIRYQLLQALAYQALRQETNALKVLQNVLEMAEPQGYCRSFVDEGSSMQALLWKIAEMRPTPYLTGLLAAFPQSAKEDLLASFTNGDQDILAFSSRQLDILRLLAAGNSNKQIAKRLELSPNTVKWYVQNLYAELSVNTRLQAVNRVRELGLDL